MVNTYLGRWVRGYLSRYLYAAVIQKPAPTLVLDLSWSQAIILRDRDEQQETFCHASSRPSSVPVYYIGMYLYT